MNWLVSLTLSALALASAFARPPNFVVILADDIGFECITGESSPDPAVFGSPGNRFWNTRLIEDGRVRDLPADRFSEDELADHALAFFRAHRDRPFFYHFASKPRLW